MLEMIAAQHISCGIYQYFLQRNADGSADIIRHIDGTPDNTGMQGHHASVSDAYDYVTNQEIDDGMCEADIYTEPKDLGLGEFVIYYQNNNG